MRSPSVVSSMTIEHRSLVRCDGCDRSYIMNTTEDGQEYLVGIPGNECTDCEGATFTPITPGSLGMTETPPASRSSGGRSGVVGE